MKAIYLDHAATSPIHPQVIEVMTEQMKQAFANPSSTHQFGRTARQSYRHSHDILAKSIGAQVDEIIMTSCGTEADNMAIFSTAQARQNLGRHIISTEIEHPGVSKALKRLEKHDFEVTYLPVDEEGQISMDDFKNALREDTILVSIMAANNEVGTCLPIEEIGLYLKESQSQAYFHTDAVQAYGLMPIDVKQMGIDLLSVSSHKINGPKGIGFLYLREGLDLPALIIGGGQERGFRAGTENVPGMAGFAKAVEIMKDNQEERRRTLIGLGDRLMEGLDHHQIDYSINGSRQQTIGHVLNLHFHGVEASTLMVQLDLKGVAVSAGSACSAGSVNPSPVLVAMHGNDHPSIHESIRFSFGLGTTEEDIDQVVDILNELINKE